MVSFESSSKLLKQAFDIAMDDMLGNIKPYRDGLLSEKRGCLLAGRDYDTPWTRDTAINVWNALAFADRETAENTLLSVLERREDGRVYIGGEYWDCIIWAQGAMSFIEITGDTSFAHTAKEAVCNSLRFFEKTEFDPQKGLFRGPAVYGDGVAAYPDKYANANSSGIKFWQLQPENKDKVCPVGVGIPMFCLSTNCVYFRAYQAAAEFCRILGLDGTEYTEKADRLRESINRNFWNEERGSYDYMAGECDGQEALGDAFAILFGIADEEKTELTVKNHHVCPHGTPCLWPNFERYEKLGGYGRHAGTIWPHAQGFWARAAFSAGDTADFDREMKLMAEKAVKNGEFHEIYHPDTGAVYGGLQEFDNTRIGEWGSCTHQTWSATAFLSLVFYCMLGIKISDGKVTFTGYLPEGVDDIRVTGLRIGDGMFDVTVTRGEGENTASLDISGKDAHSVSLFVK